MGEIATEMNNGEFCIDNRQYYDAQLDYLLSKGTVFKSDTV